MNAKYKSITVVLQNLLARLKLQRDKQSDRQTDRQTRQKQYIQDNMIQEHKKAVRHGSFSEYAHVDRKGARQPHVLSSIYHNHLKYTQS